MKNRLDKAIEEKSEKDLQDCIAELFEHPGQIDQTYFSRIERLLVEKWHHAHEDILGLIWLKEIRDNRFVDPIMSIAQQGEIYRPYDDELESTLRKCIHALQTISTAESISAIKKLQDTGNENVQSALENYH